ncbi:MAG: hypothetical protein V7L11_02960 [Nostoc sp.]|uniref:hypothetical protein n=1 Tax=Nostoc sp. TaxID=1180 RepID=UPI002FF56CED
MGIGESLPKFWGLGTGNWALVKVYLLLFPIPHSLILPSPQSPVPSPQSLFQQTVIEIIDKIYGE